VDLPAAALTYVSTITSVMLCAWPLPLNALRVHHVAKTG